MIADLRAIRSLGTARLLAGLVACVAAPASWSQAGAAEEPVGFVLSGWSASLNANQLIQRWMRRDTDSRASPIPRPEWSHGRLNELSVARDALRRVKNGVGMDLRLFRSGGLHFNLYSRDRIKGEGVRMTLRERAAGVDTQRWTLGGSMQQVRTEEGDRFVRFVPQLIVNPDGPHAVMQRWKFSLEYGYWFGGDKRAAVDERVLQASVSARF